MWTFKNFRLVVTILYGIVEITAFQRISMNSVITSEQIAYDIEAQFW